MKPHPHSHPHTQHQHQHIHQQHQQHQQQQQHSSSNIQVTSNIPSSHNNVNYNQTQHNINNYNHHNAAEQLLSHNNRNNYASVSPMDYSQDNLYQHNLNMSPQEQNTFYSRHNLLDYPEGQYASEINNFTPIGDEYELFGRNDPSCYYPVGVNANCLPVDHCSGYYLPQDRYYSPLSRSSYGPLPQSRPSPSISDLLNEEQLRPVHPFVETVQEQAATYSPFARNFLEVNLSNPEPKRETEVSPAFVRASEENVQTHLPRKESEVILGAEPITKKRIVAEVKPMRPSYSDILAKGPRPAGLAPSTPDVERKKRDYDFETSRNKSEKVRYGQDRGTHVEDHFRREINPRMPPKMKYPNENDFFDSSSKTSAPIRASPLDEQPDIKWVSLDDLTEEKKFQKENEKNDLPVDNKSQRRRNVKNEPESDEKDDDDDDDDSDENDESELSDEEESVERSPSPPLETEKIKRKSKDRYHNRSTAKNSDKFKKKTQSKQKRCRNFTFSNFLRIQSDRWMVLLKKALMWFCCLILDIFQMSSQLIVDFYYAISNETISKGRTVLSYLKNHFTNTQWLCDFGNYVDSKFGQSKLAFWRRFWPLKSKNKLNDNSEKYKTLKTNIPLPATREEAMKRLLERKGKDPYSILGVGVDCSDDDIKRYYRRQAFLVHPDKNPQPGAEEAFKILQHAFDLIGEPERREAYDRKLIESQHAEAAWTELSELLTQLHDKVKHAAGTIRCTNCSRRHKKTITDRPCYAARYCSQCKIHHSAKEGDIWAESGFWGIFWMYYACMDGAVYQISQWASCQKKNLKHLKANTHHVQYRIVSGNKAGVSNNSGKSHCTNTPDPNLEDFLSNLYTKSNMGSTSGTNGTNSTTPNDVSKNKRKTKKKL